MDIRKISVGPDFKSGAMHYLVGQEILNGQYFIHLIDISLTWTVNYCRAAGLESCLSTPSMPNVVPVLGGNSSKDASHCLVKTCAGTKTHMFSASQRVYSSDSCQALSKGSALRFMSFGQAVWTRTAEAIFPSRMAK